MSFSAHSNSSASMPRPTNTTAQPGPGSGTSASPPRKITNARNVNATRQGVLRWTCLSRRRASFSASVLCSGADSVTGDEVPDLDEGAGALRGVPAVARQPGARGHVAVLLPCEQDRMRIDRVLGLAAGVDLEVDVRRGRLGVAGVAGEAEDVSGLDPAAILGVGGEGREVGVEERVAGVGVEPQAVAGDRERTHAVHGAVGDREHGSTKGGEDVVALVDAGVGAGGAEVV